MVGICSEYGTQVGVQYKFQQVLLLTFGCLARNCYKSISFRQGRGGPEGGWIHNSATRLCGGGGCGRGDGRRPLLWRCGALAVAVALDAVQLPQSGWFSSWQGRAGGGRKKIVFREDDEILSNH